MYKDKYLELAKNQAVTASAATTDFINALKEGDAIGEELYLVVKATEAALAAGAATLEFKLETASDDVFTSPVVLFSSGPIGKAAITVGKELVKIKLPLGLKQFTRGYFTVATGPLTAGKFDVFMTPAVDVR